MIPGMELSAPKDQQQDKVYSNEFQQQRGAEVRLAWWSNGVLLISWMVSLRSIKTGQGREDAEIPAAGLRNKSKGVRTVRYFLCIDFDDEECEAFVTVLVRSETAGVERHSR